MFKWKFQRRKLATLLAVAVAISAVGIPTFVAAKDEAIVIQAADFDEGIQGEAYYDTTPGNQGDNQTYRPDTDMELWGQPPRLGLQATEWVNYTRNLSAGSYRITVNTASASTQVQMSLYVDGVKVIDSGSVTVTNSWGVFANTLLGNFDIPVSGLHTLKLEAVVGDMTFSHFVIEPSQAPIIETRTILAADYTDYFTPRTEGNVGNNQDYRPGTKLNIWEDNPPKVGFQPGEWVAFQLELTAGDYDVSVLTASEDGDSFYTVFLNDNEVIPRPRVPGTGGWAPYETSALGRFNVGETGTHVIKFLLEENACTFVSFTLTTTLPEPEPTPTPVVVTVDQLDEQTVTNSVFLLSGTTGGDATEVQITLNDNAPVVFTGQVQTYSYSLMLNPGANYIHVNAKNAQETEAEPVERTVYFLPTSSIGGADNAVFKVDGPDGTRIGKLRTGTITGVANVFNKSGDAITPLFVVALYEGTKLKTLSLSEDTVPLGDGVTRRYWASVDVTGNVAEQTIKILVWNDKNTIKPFSEFFTLIEDEEPPQWPEGSVLTARATAPGEVFLSWSMATDNTMVSYYKIYSGDANLLTLDGTTTEATLSGLQGDTEYSFSVRAVDVADNLSPQGPTATVRTLQDFSTLAMSLYVAADTHIRRPAEVYNTNLTNAVRDADNNQVDGMVFLGDLTETGEEYEMKLLKEAIDVAEPSIPAMYYLFGNHETRQQTGGMEAIIQRFYDYTGHDSYYYTDVINGYRIIALNGEQLMQNEAYISEAQFQFLRESLADGADANRPIFVFLHQPTNLLGNSSQSSTLTSILEEYPQVIYVHGHTHTGNVTVQKTDGRYTVVTASSTKNTTPRAALIKVYGDRVDILGRNVNNATESFSTSVYGPTPKWLSDEITRAINLRTGKSIGTSPGQYASWANDYLGAVIEAAQNFSVGSATSFEIGEEINRLRTAQQTFKKSQNLGQPPGEHTIQGRLFNSTGQVITGARIAAYAQGEEESPVTEIVTDKDGIYTLSGLDGGVYTVKAISYGDSGVQVVVPYQDLKDADITVNPATVSDTQPPQWQTGSALTVTDITGSTVSLSWSAASDDTEVTLYKVYANGVLLQAISGQSCTLTNLSPNTDYTFAVKVGDSANNWTQALEIADKTLPEVAPPSFSSPSLTADEVGLDALTLHWTAAQDDVGVESYRVYQNGQIIGETQPDETSFRVTGLNLDTQYTFRVEAGDASGKWSTNGPTLSVSTLADTQEPTWVQPSWFNTPLCPPSLLVASNLTPTTVDLKWLKPTPNTGAIDDTGVTQYKVYRNGSLLTTLPGTVNTYKVLGLTPGTSYQFTVQAGDAYDNWSTDGPTVTAIPGVNVALGKTVTTSGADAEYPGSNLTDGIVEFANGWSSNQSLPIWAQIDLGTPTVIRRIELEDRPELGYNSERLNFEIRASNDPSFASYVTLGAVGINAVLDECTWVLPVDTTEAYRYVRYEKVNQPFYVFVPEIRVYAK